jgi:hypothetical protein
MITTPNPSPSPSYSGSTQSFNYYSAVVLMFVIIYCTCCIL